MNMKILRSILSALLVLSFAACSSAPPVQPPSDWEILAATTVTPAPLPPFGADNLGGKHYPKAAVKAAKKGDVTGIFLRTFGDARQTVLAWAKSGKFSEIVVHLAPFDNSHTYPIKKLQKQVLADAKWIQKNVVAVAKDTKILISPFCEHNHKARDSIPLFDKVRKAAPGALMVNSIWKGDEIPGTITEIHIPSSKQLPNKPKNQYTVSFDGFGGDGSGDFTDANLAPIFSKYSDARHIRFWNFRFNGKFGHKDTTPISQRKHWPDVKYIKGHRAQMKHRAGAITWPNNSLYKPFADDHGAAPPTKDNKAMVILPVKKSSVIVRDSNGKQIGKMNRYLPDHSGDPQGARYYAPVMAFELADAAKKSSGSELIEIDGMPPTDGYLRSNRLK